MNKIRAGVAGLGHMGRNHARILSELPEAEFSAVYDLNASIAAEISDKFGVASANSLEEFAEMVDAATIVTPTPTHHSIGKQLLRKGKHLLIEKPITENPTEAKELVSLAQERGLVLQVGHIERFNPVMGALEARLSTPRFIECHRLSPYPNRSIEIGVVLDLMIHDLEIVLHLVRSPVESVDAVGVPVLSRGEDIANARLRFENGCVANLTVSRISPEKMRKLRVFQEDAYLSLDYQNQTGEIHSIRGGRIAREPVEIERDDPLTCQLRSFLECAKQGATPRVSGNEATAALELAIEITRQIEAQGLQPGASVAALNA
jgi:predicted dehydrogenase